MKAVENFQANGIDGVVLHAQQALIDVINQVTAINKYGPVSQKAFVLLCNDLAHIKQHIFEADVANFTVAQKKVFLKEVVDKCPDSVFTEEEKSEFLQGLENLSNNDLSVKIKELQEKIEEFFAATKLQIATTHAKAIGRKVQEVYGSLEQQVSEGFSKIKWDDIKNTEAKRKQLEEFSKEQANIIATATNLVGTLQAVKEGGAKETVFREFKNALSIEIQNHVATDLKQVTTEDLKKNITEAFSTKIGEIIKKQIADQAASLQSQHKAESVNKEQEEGQARKKITTDFDEEMGIMAILLQESLERQQQIENQEENRKLIIAQEQFTKCVNMAMNDAYANVEQNKQAVQKTIGEFQNPEESSKKFSEYITSQLRDQLVNTLGVQENTLNFATQDAAYSLLGDIELAYKAKQEYSARKALEVLEKVALVAEFPEKAKESTNINLYLQWIANDTTHAIRAILEPLKKTATLGSSRFF